MENPVSRTVKFNTRESSSIKEKGKRVTVELWINIDSHTTVFFFNRSLRFTCFSLTNSFLNVTKNRGSLKDVVNKHSDGSERDSVDILGHTPFFSCFM